MPAAVRACEDHGFFEGAQCPVCESPGEVILDGDRRRRLSKFLSGALRHFPEDAGLELDNAGWTPFEAVVAAAEPKYGWAARRAVDGVIATDPKGRFERDERTESGDTDGEAVVRAAYGHSVDVDLEAAETPVPDALYHGTAPRNVEAIREDGLEPMSRQLVHLSGTVAEAREVGRRHADDPVVLEVDAAAMLDDGREITKRGRGVYTTERVPSEYLAVTER